MKSILPCFALVALTLAAAAHAPRPAAPRRAVPSGVRAASLAPRPGKPAAAQEARLRQAMLRIPLQFEANRGQTDSRVRFLARAGRTSLFLTGREAVLALNAPAADAWTKAAGALPRPTRARPAVVRMQWVGARRHPRLRGEQQLPGKVNYF